MAGMVAGQIPIAAGATSVTSSANLSGDVTSAPTTLVTTLATVNANVGTFQGITVNAKGLVTAAINQSYLTSAAAAAAYFPLPGGTMTGALVVNGALTSAAGVSTGDAVYELGLGRTGSGNAYIDLHGAAGTDFEFRILRAAGANGQASINQAGTGGLDVLTNGVSRWTIDTSGLTTIAGGLGVGVAPVNGSNPVCVFHRVGKRRREKHLRQCARVQAGRWDVGGQQRRSAEG